MKQYEIVATAVIKSRTDELTYPTGSTIEQIQKFEEDSIKEIIEQSVLNEGINLTVAVRELQS